MAKTNRIAYQNRILTAGAVIVPSSEESGMPRAALLRPQFTDVLRFKPGWTIRLNENDRVEFDTGGGPSVALITPGYYATGTALAAAIVTALEAADAAPVWACDYNVAATATFRISANVAFSLLFAHVVPNTYELSAHLDLGFTSSDKASAVSHTAENVAYQSRHTVNVDLGAAASFAVAIVRGHNVSAAGVVRLDADAATMIQIGYSASALDFTATLAGTDPRIVYFASQSFRYLRLVIDDVQNSAGYNELGVWFVGPYVTPSVLESVDFVKRLEQLSSVHYAIGGAHTMVERAKRDVYALVWEEVPQADADLFEALQIAMPMGSPFFLSLDAVDNPTDTLYGFLREPLALHMRPAAYWNVPLEFAESLG